LSAVSPGFARIGTFLLLHARKIINIEMRTIAAFSQSADAYLLKHQLEAAGIHCSILDEVFGSIIGGGQALGSVRVQVSDDDVEEAEPIVSEFRSRLQSDESGQQPVEYTSSSLRRRSLQVMKITSVAGLLLLLFSGLWPLIVWILANLLFAACEQGIIENKFWRNVLLVLGFPGTLFLSTENPWKSNPNRDTPR
jgi:hypothetical protein